MSTHNQRPPRDFSGIADILPHVDQASRYIGTEINSIRKASEDIRLHIALAFPDLYEIGTSHFGIQILYHILNRHAHICAERVYAPGLDMEKHLRSGNIPLMSLESQTPLQKFDWIGFSLLYELTYTNLVAMMDLAQIPLRSSDRKDSHPLIIAGGPSTCNPEPVADFFDAMVFGDGETVVARMASAWIEWARDGKKDKIALLKSWSRIPGIYIPSFFRVSYDHLGFQRIHPVEPEYEKVERAIVANLDEAEFPVDPIVPFGKPIHDRLRLEISRGCSRGCRFCQAGMIYRPVRERSGSTLLELAQESIQSTGYEDISLLSLSTGDYSCLSGLMSHLMDICMPLHISVSLPSIRADKLASGLMETIRKVRKTGFTIAPEAGSQRLRNVINKNLHHDDIVQTVSDAFSLGWKVIKLYFMIGLPTETRADLEAMEDLIRELKALQKRKMVQNRSARIHISLTSFIPKPHTPFQWASQISIQEAQETFRWFKFSCNLPGVDISWQNPEVSRIEGLFARGDRRLGYLLETAYSLGCRFDGWTDHFRFDLWETAIKTCQIDIDWFISRKRDLEEPLPWDHMDSGVSREFLQSEWDKAHLEVQTPDCRFGDCQQCGICDFQETMPRLSPPLTETDHLEPIPAGGVPGWEKYDFLYSKSGNSRYLGQLELYNILSRAFRKSGIPVQFSTGFHPKPKFSFFDALPVGMEAYHERFQALIQPYGSADAMAEQLNTVLPSGLHIDGCSPASNTKGDRSFHATYEIQGAEKFLHPNRLRQFHDSDTFPITRTNHKGISRELDLKKHVVMLAIDSAKRLLLTVREQDGIILRPSDIMAHVFDMKEADIRGSRIIKRGSPPSSGKDHV
jgi:radical SAM family uncharacterized protein/radical SAM-linked protein